MRRVALVAGPPCGGKTTFVGEQAQPGDIVVDFDVIARELGSRRDHLHTGPLVTRANREFRRRCDEVAAMRSGTAWVIRCAASPRKRAAFAAAIRATEVVVLAPPREIALARAEARPQAARTAQLVREWYAVWRANDGDIVLAGGDR